MFIQPCTMDSAICPFPEQLENELDYTIMEILNQTHVSVLLSVPLFSVD